MSMYVRHIDYRWLQARGWSLEALRDLWRRQLQDVRWQLDQIEEDPALVAPPSINWSFYIILGKEKLDREQSESYRKFRDWYPDYELRGYAICEILNWSSSPVGKFLEWERARGHGLSFLQTTAGWRERGILQWLPKHFRYRGGLVPKENLDIAEWVYEHIDNGERLRRLAAEQDSEDDDGPNEEPRTGEYELGELTF